MQQVVKSEQQTNIECSERGGGPALLWIFLLHTLQPYCTPSNLTAHPPTLLHTLLTSQIYCTPSKILHTLQNTAHPLNLAAHPLNLAAHPPNLTAHHPKLQPLFSHRKFKYWKSKNRFNRALQALFKELSVILGLFNIKNIYIIVNRSSQGKFRKYIV